jgi:hypothetical protein
MWEVKNLHDESLSVDEQSDRGVVSVGLPKGGTIYMKHLGPVTEVLARKGCLTTRQMTAKEWEAHLAKLDHPMAIRRQRLAKVKFSQGKIPVSALPQNLRPEQKRRPKKEKEFSVSKSSE